MHVFSEDVQGSKYCWLSMLESHFACLLNFQRRSWLSREKLHDPSTEEEMATREALLEGEKWLHVIIDEKRVFDPACRVNKKR
jgi:hypothetical protein